MKSDSKKFDQFYTKIEIAKEVLEETLLILKKLNYKKDNILFVEPSAGNGSFIEVIRNKKMPFLAYDIDVKKEYIKKNNFLTQDISKDLPIKDKVVIIGNPPFGKRAKLAIDFINTAFKYTDTVAFILPLQFNKYSAQKEINHSANLVFHKKLNEKSFIYLEKEYSVRCCLQVWTKKTNLQDLRIRKAPQIEHQDFKMWQYNNTIGARKYFNKNHYGWDFAVPRQGFKDYSIKETNPNNLDIKTQWIFFKAKNKKVLNNLSKIDFNKLSHKNTSIPGFGKADVIEEYNSLYYKDNSVISTSTQTFQLGEPNPNFAETLSLFPNL